MNLRTSILSAIGSTMLLGAAQPATVPVAGVASVARWAEGRYGYRSLSTGASTGGEAFYLTVHPDGTRTMRAFTEIAARGVQVNVVLRADNEFRPLDAYVSIYSGGKLRGIGQYTVSRGRLTATLVAGSHGETKATQIPADLSMLAHPLALDGWHSAYARDAAGQQQTIAAYFIDGDPRSGSKGMLGEVRHYGLTYLGAETTTVPAGTFETRHYQLGGHSDIWVTGPDRMLVRYLWRAIDREYVLQSLRTGTGETAFTKTKGESE